MCPDLDRLIEEARRYQMTPEERESQIRSFAYGNTRLENGEITRDDIERAAKSTPTEDSVVLVY
jgi:hypothetical protein